MLTLIEKESFDSFQSSLRTALLLCGSRALFSPFLLSAPVSGFLPSAHCFSVPSPPLLQARNASVQYE